MQIQINRPGLLTTVQDSGRLCHRGKGVPVGGAMDSLAATIANCAVGNPPVAAVVEYTLANASFTTLTDVLIAYSGGGAVWMLNDMTLPVNRPIFLPAGHTVILHAQQPGCRTYLAVAGGWKVTKVLGSSSTYLPAKLGGYKGRTLQKGDVLSQDENLSPVGQRMYAALQGNAVQVANWCVNPSAFLLTYSNVIRMVAGPEADWFSQAILEQFEKMIFRISTDSNRMGFRLLHQPLLKEREEELLSTAVMPGTIQVTNSGNCILLMADSQTTGGYPRIAQVAAVDMHLCGQMQPGDEFSMQWIDRTQAEKLYLERQQKLLLVQQAIELKY